MKQNIAQRIDYELLRTFVMAGQARTFGEAAEQRGVSVSAVSQQVKALETQLGMPLFERIGRRARLTDAGRELLGVLRLELSRIDDALEAMSDAHGSVRGGIAIGSPRPFGRYWLRPRLAELLAAHPELRVRVEFDVPSVLERRLVDGSLDLVILVRAPEHPAVDSTRIASETFVAVAARSYLREHGTPRSLADFQAQRWVTFDRDLPMHAAWWRAQFGPRAAPPARIVCEIASVEEMLGLVEAGVAIAVLPDYLRSESSGCELVELSPSSSRRTVKNPIQLAWRRGAVESARLIAARAALRAQR